MVHVNVKLSALNGEQSVLQNPEGSLYESIGQVSTQVFVKGSPYLEFVHEDEHKFVLGSAYVPEAHVV